MTTLSTEAPRNEQLFEEKFKLDCIFLASISMRALEMQAPRNKRVHRECKARTFIRLWHMVAKRSRLDDWDEKKKKKTKKSNWIRVRVVQWEFELVRHTREFPIVDCDVPKTKNHCNFDLLGAELNAEFRVWQYLGSPLRVSMRMRRRIFGYWFDVHVQVDTGQRRRVVSIIFLRAFTSFLLHFYKIQFFKH